MRWNSAPSRKKPSDISRRFAMSLRFTVADLLISIALVGLVLAAVVPVWRHVQRVRYFDDEVIEVAASADGTTFGALLGDGRVLIWDSEGNLKSTLPTLGTFGGCLALSFDGKLAAVSPAGPNEYVNVTPRGTVEIWDIAQQKVRGALPVRCAMPRFSAANNSLLISYIIKGNPPSARYELYSADNDDPPRIVSEPKATCAAFSPDAARFAIGTMNGKVQIFNAADLHKERELVAVGPAKIDGIARVAFAPGGGSIAALVSENGESYSIITWELSNGRVRRVAPRVSGYRELSYSPDGRRLFYTADAGGYHAVGPDRSAAQVFDAQTLEPLAAPALIDAPQIAGGMRGKTFVTTNKVSVDLRETATLQPRRRLYEGRQWPNVWPAVGCFMLWLIVLAIRLRRKTAADAPEST